MKGYLYSIDVGPKRYIGGSVNPQRRLHDHNNNLTHEDRKDYNGTFYKYLRENGCNKLEQSDLNIVEEIEVADKTELRQKEQQFMLHVGYDNIVNNRFAYGKNPKKVLEAGRRRRAVKKGQPKEQMVCACGATLNKSSKAKHERTERHKLIMEKEALIKMALASSVSVIVPDIPSDESNESDNCIYPFST